MIRPQPRPRFARWRHERNLTCRRTAALLEAEAVKLGIEGFTCSHETVRLVCLPFGAPRRRVPATDLLLCIASLTDDWVGEGDFHEPEAVAA